MKSRLFLLMMLAASTISAQNTLTVVVDGIEEVRGHLMIVVNDKENKPVAWKTEKIEDETLTLVFDSIPVGEYAVSAYQDENDNGKLDTGLYGIPKEKYGFSNNARGTMGAPAFEELLFKVEEDTEINITLR
jgi:uncharacterized protein (DUF2141 family)